MSLLNWIIILVSTFLLICYLLKKEKNWTVKIIYGFLAFSFYILLFIYFLDDFNLPTILLKVNNVNTQNWLNFLGTYISAIITAGASSVFLYFITEHQINKSDNMNKENLRIQNIPLLKYDFSLDIKNDISKINTIIIPNISQNNIDICIGFVIKNIGLGAIKDIFILVKNDKIKEHKFYFENHSIIEKGESREIDFLISSPQDNVELIFNIKYKDILNNWYSQKITLQYTMIKGYSNLKFNVSDEQVIENMNKTY